MMLPDVKYIAADVDRALLEDLGSGDVTAQLLPDSLRLNAKIISREPMLVCGKPWVNRVFEALDPTLRVTWMVEEGQWLSTPCVLCEIRGAARPILSGERTALNFLQTLSGTATQTYTFLERLNGYYTRLLDTRKTIPGLRRAQKYAVACAGGTNHRMGLYDAFLIKENHIAACGSITQAVLMARKNQKLFVEIEVENLIELKEALKVRPDRIMLDNFTLDMIREAVLMNSPKTCELEASGNVNLSTIQAIAETGVDYVSIGAITKSLKAIDLSLLVEEVL